MENKSIQHHLPLALSKMSILYSSQRVGVQLNLKQTSPKGVKICLVAISNKFTNGRRDSIPFDLQWTMIRKGQKNTTRQAYFNCLGVSNAKHDNLNAYSKFLLQSRFVHWKGGKTTPLNCSLQIKALFLSDFPPRSASFANDLPTHLGPFSRWPERELAHTFRSPNPRAGQPRRLAFASCWLTKTPPERMWEVFIFSRGDVGQKLHF